MPNAAAAARASEECQSRTREPARGKRELIEQNNESDGNDQRGAGKNRGTAHPDATSRSLCRIRSI